MAQQTLNNGESGLIIRGKLNDNFTELYAGLVAGVALTDMPAASALGGTELFYVLQGGVDSKGTATQIKTWCSASPTLVTPALGVATAASIAIAGATLGGYKLAVAGDVEVSGAVKTAGVALGTRGYMFPGSADGIFQFTDSTQVAFDMLQLGPATSSGPGIKRNGVGLEIKLADNSAFTSIKGKLTTDTAATTGLTAGVLSALTNASMVWYDGGGQAYRVPCII